MTNFEPIIRHCDMCGKDMSIHSLTDNYHCAIGVGDKTLCGDCFCIHTNTEPIDISGYEPHHIVWPETMCEDTDNDEDYDSEEIAADEPMQLEMFT